MPSNRLYGGNEINHVLIFNCMQLAQYDIGDAGLWLSMSDHYPLVALAQILCLRFTHIHAVKLAPCHCAVLVPP